jgi:hypothetical protein
MDPPVALVSAASTTPSANLTPTMVVPVFLWDIDLKAGFSLRSSFLN